MPTTTPDLNPALLPWPTVTPDDEKKLAALAVPYVRWLNRDLVAGLVQDNEQHRASWEKVFVAADVITDLYLWPGSACTYPGIRRKTGKNEQTGGVGVQSLQLDRSGNHMAHRVWELLGITKSGFKIDRKGYELVHLFPHKAAEWKKLLKILAAAPGVAPVPADWSTHLISHGLPGLFTNPANMCFLPSVLVRPTDGHSLLRQVLWKKALSLYGSAALLPPELASPMQQWLALQPEPTTLEWSECYHGDASLLHKLLTDRASHLTRHQPSP